VNFELVLFCEILVGLGPEEAAQSPYIASMGIYVFKKDVLVKLLKDKYPHANDFGGEIIPWAASDGHKASSPALSAYCNLFRRSTMSELGIGASTSWARVAEARAEHAKLDRCRQVMAYLFNDYWEDIGTIKSFFEANLALAAQVLSCFPATTMKP